MDSRYRVVVKSRASVVWPFNGEPYIQILLADIARHQQVDPFPCYMHDIFVVDDMLKHVTTQLPINMGVTVSVLEHEVSSRVNGYAEAREENNSTRVQGSIVLSGKRTPIHPAMTKYLVAHEYGHLVQRALEFRDKHVEYSFDNLYADLRGIPRQPDGYGGGTWHLAPGELFANDFRLLVCRCEVAFWPHPDIARPETIPAIQNFWEITRHAFLAEAKARDTIAKSFDTPDNTNDTSIALSSLALAV